MNRVYALGVGAIATALAATAVASSATAVTPADVPAVTADIRVELDLPPSPGPLVFEVIGVPVGDGVELPGGTSPASNPSEWSGDASVDISLDPFTVTLGGGDYPANFETATYTITLHGAEFGEATLVSDELFQTLSSGTPEGVVDIAGGAGAPASGVAPLALSAPLPVLSAVGTSGSTFTATWTGTADAYMYGTAVFSFATADDGEEAEGAAPVPADPTFTG